jgi:TonB-dependent receptor
MNRIGHSYIFSRILVFFVAMTLPALPLLAQQSGGIRGMVYDKEFDAPLAGAQVSIAETGAKAVAADEGNYIFNQVEPGRYTLVFSKDGYTRQVSSDVVVSGGQMADVNSALSGEFTEMDEFVAQDLEIGGGSEEGLLNLRAESPALMDSVSSDLMSRAGASDAAGALRLVAGASVQDGKYAVVRGLPDRYVSSQMNSVRLPSADPDKRAVQLDQFPSELIESIQVSKTFTPDQQGDASGGAVNLKLKGIPDETVLKFSVGTEYNTQATGKDDFLTYKDGGVNFRGIDDGRRDQQPAGTNNWKGAVGVSRDEAPIPYNWSLIAGGKREIMDGLHFGGLGNFFYKHDSSYFEEGVDDAYWVETPGAPMTPQYGQGTPSQGDFKTSLFDLSQGSEEVQWGGLGAAGFETEDHKLMLMYMRTQATEDTATLAEDTRGKAYYFPGYNPDDPNSNGHGMDYEKAAPYLRNETLEYTERKTDTLQLRGDHTLPFPEIGFPGYFVILPPEVDWTAAKSFSGLNSPDKRLFGSSWVPDIIDPGHPVYGGGGTNAAIWSPSKPDANYTMGNLQRIWKEITEDSDQYSINGKIPFEQWTGDKGYLKGGVFQDQLKRRYDQDSFSNLSTLEYNPGLYQGGWDDFWSEAFPSQNHLMSAVDIDVDYTGEQNIDAMYYMLDIPLCSFFNVIGGMRYESTELGITLDPEEDVTWIPPGTSTESQLKPGDADVQFEQNDVLPALGFEFKPHEDISLRASYSETVARQTFKELTPIQQMEYLGGDVFVGNPNLTMSSLKNYDLRADYTPFEGSLLSASWFKKDVKDPIEYAQKISTFLYTTAINYPEGELSGYEFEFRQQLGRFWDPLEGLAVGANVTFIRSEVTLPDDEAAQFESPAIMAPMETRDMVNAPEYLYNLNLTYDIQKTGTQLGLFYTVQGDTLVAGAGVSGDGYYIPNVYAKEYGTLNFSISQKIGEHWKLGFKAKNLLDPEIQEVYRSDFVDGDTVKTSYTKGIEYSISAGYEF